MTLLDGGSRCHLSLTCPVSSGSHEFLLKFDETGVLEGTVTGRLELEANMSCGFEADIAGSLR